MYLMNRLQSRPLRTAAHFLFALSLTVGGFPLTALAQSYVPPNWGLPGRREGGATRGCWQNTTAQSTTTQPTTTQPPIAPITAIVPETNTGYTLSPYPTFFVYVSQPYAEQAVAAEFVLLDEEQQEVYRSTFQTSDTAGVLSLTLPSHANLAPLEVGKTYHWAFALVCNLDDRSGDLVVDSWIQRVEPTGELAATLQTAPPEQLPSIYAQAGIWYEALTSLSQLRYQPGVAMPTSQWQNLLNSVDLGHLVADDNLVQSLNLPASEEIAY